MNNQAFSKNWIIIILVVLVVGGILGWQYLKNWRKMPEVEIKSPIEKKEVNFWRTREELNKQYRPYQPEPIKEWKTYIDEEYKYEIKYPKTFVIRKYYFPEEEDKPSTVIFLTPEQAQIPPEAAPGMQSDFLSIRATKVDPKMSLEDLIKNRYPFRGLFSKINPGFKVSSPEEAQEKFDGLSYFNKITIGEGISGYLLHFWGKWGISKIFIKYEDALIEISDYWSGGDYTYFLENPIVHKMLSSFKFLE